MRHLALLIMAAVLISSAGSRLSDARPDQKPSPSEILSLAAEHGKETLQALRRYTYSAELTIETVSEADTLNQYEMSYVGSERIDELNTYVFDVKPKVKLPDPEKSTERYLKGRVWIDDQDLCVVKVAGNALPEQYTHRTPRFETYFQNHDKYWFPAYTSADDDVRVGRRAMRVIVKVRFMSYKKAGIGG
jgi:hypothetical protein